MNMSCSGSMDSFVSSGTELTLERVEKEREVRDSLVC